MSGHHYDPLVAMSVTFGISYEQTPWNKNWDPPAFPLWREENLLKEAMSVFYEIRTYRDIRKKPSTSELIDWINALQIGGIPTATIRKALPFVGVIVKKDEDLDTVRQKLR